jgi:hypothetical protein
MMNYNHKIQRMKIEELLMVVVVKIFSFMLMGLILPLLHRVIVKLVLLIE